MRFVHCYLCATQFSMDDALFDKRVADHRDFYCPNGHKQQFIGKTEDEKTIERLERSRRVWEEQYAIVHDELKQWRQAMRFCPICRERVSQARSPEVAAHKLSLHLQEIHHARGAVLALMPGASA
jgi:hypothetical protein